MNIMEYKKSIRNLSPIMGLLIVLFLWMGCKEENKERFETPPWLGGSSIKTLEDEGNYTEFLRLMDKANYREPISKQLFTLFVPNDAAFEQFFKSYPNKDSVGDLTDDEAVQLFTLHVLRNPRSRYQLIYEFVWNEEQGPDGEYASLFNRKLTPSESKPYLEYVKYDPDKKGDTVLVYTNTKYVPLFSRDYFEDFFADPDGSDYLAMYPNSNYDNTSPISSKAMNWHNAMVLPNPDNEDEMEVRTASGFIYYIDQVVAPMPSIEEYLIQNQEDYSVFYDLMQRFATYGAPRRNQDSKIEYRKLYTQFPDVADDWGPGDGREVRQKDMFSAFVPGNGVLQPWLDQNILNTYPSLDSVPEITLSYIVRSHLNRSLGVISKMSQGIYNDFGDPLVIKAADVNSGFMCSNGAFYDLKKVLEPSAFTGVAGNLFFNSNYSTFLFALNEVDLITNISNPDRLVTLFAPSNDELLANNIRYNSISRTIESKGVDQTWRTMKNTDLVMLVQDHIANEKVMDVSGDGFIRMSSGTYIHYLDGVITGPDNQFEGDVITVKESIETGENAMLYNIQNVIRTGYYTMGKLLWNDPEVKAFADLLDDARLLNRRIRDPLTKELTPRLLFTAEAENWTAFIPTNEAVEAAAAAGLIPDKSDRDSLQSFLLNHFVRDYTIFDDGNPEGSGLFYTNKLAPVTPDGPKYEPVIIQNDRYNLTITDNSGQVITVEHAKANNLAKQSVVHKINTVMKY